MPLDKTPKIAKGLTKAQRKSARGERYFFVKAAPWDSQGVLAIPLGSDPNGEIKSGVFLDQGYGGLDYIARICELGVVTREALSEAWGIAVLRAGATVANVFERKGLPIVPLDPNKREWRLGLTFTQQTFVPASPITFDYSQFVAAGVV